MELQEKTQQQIREELTEMVAAMIHDQWVHWMKHMMQIGSWSFGYDTFIFPGADVARWKRQMVTPYPHLTPGEKDSDRKLATRLIEVLAQGGWLPAIAPIEQPEMKLDRTELREKFAEKLARYEEGQI